MKKIAPLSLSMVSILAVSIGCLAADENPIRVLVLTGRNNHNWKATTPVLQEMYEQSGQFAVEVTDEPHRMTSQMLSRFDVIVSNWCAWPDVTGRQWGPTAEKAFTRFLRGGKGFALFHAASATFHDWPEYQQMAGATWKLGQTGHGRIHDFTVRITNSDHPVTQGLRDFVIRDELWHRMGKQDDIRVLGEAYSAKDAGGSGQAEPVVICTQFGKGRCFYNILGHDARTMRNPAWRTLMLRGTQWAATGNVTIPAAKPWPDPTDQKEPAFRWKQTDDSLTLMNGPKIVWRFGLNHKSDRAYFHPVCLPDGTEVTWDGPPDHPWHHGLWFSWKFINGLNYWEEDRRTGQSAGRRNIEEITFEPRDDFSANIEVSLNYHPPGKVPVLTEYRTITIEAPGPDGRYRIDWAGRFQAAGQDVLLNRTPIPGEKNGKSWGGYAGLSVRVAEDIADWRVIDSERREGLEGHGKTARWMAFAGGTPEGGDVGIAMFDDPGNARHPTPWFVIANPKVPFGYFSPALLFNEPLTLPAGETLTLKYRVLVHPGPISPEHLDAEWKRLAEKKEHAVMHRRLIDNRLQATSSEELLSAREILDIVRGTLKHGESRSRTTIDAAGSIVETADMEAADPPPDEPSASPRISRQHAPPRAPLAPQSPRTSTTLSDLSQLTPETSFGRAVDMLRNATDPPLNIIVYWKDLRRNANIDQSTPIGINGLSGVPLRTTLSLMLRALGGGFTDLGYTVQDGVIIIATADTLPVDRQTRVYDIRDLYHNPYNTMFPFGMGGFGAFGGYGRSGGLGGYGNNAGYRGAVR